MLVGIGLLFPRQLVGLLLGAQLSDATTILMARHWSLLGALAGGLLVYAGYHPDVRVPAMMIGATEKLVFGALILASPLRTRLITISVVCLDVAMALIYVLALVQAQI